LQHGTGVHTLNRGIGDIFEETSGDTVNCPLTDDTWICELRNYYDSCAAGSTPGGAGGPYMSINNNIISYDTDATSNGGDYCYFCIKNDDGTTTISDPARFVYAWDYCTSNVGF
jgi:hypothetical protein